MAPEVAALGMGWSGGGGGGPGWQGGGGGGGNLIATSKVVVGRSSAEIPRRCLVRGWWTAFLARAMVSMRCRPVLAVVADWLRLGLRLRRQGRELAAPILLRLALHPGRPMRAR